jgi:hypothetical protein
MAFFGRGFMHADGAICVTARALEPQTCAWAASVFARKDAEPKSVNSPPFFALGPLMPAPSDASQAQRAGEFAQAADEARDVAAFLERMGRERGKGSVLYVRPSARLHYLFGGNWHNRYHLAPYLSPAIRPSFGRFWRQWCSWGFRSCVGLLDL